MFSLTNKVAVITGGSRGIGRATAILFAKAGADVVISFRSNKAQAESVVQEVEATGRRCIAVKGKFAEDAHCRELIQTAEHEFGKLDILVNNAGIWTYGPIDEMPEDVWRETLEVNLSGAVYCTRYAVQQMKQQHGGKIIFVSSTSGQIGEAYYSHYAATKGAFISLTKSLASELAPDITVNCVAPWWVDTDLAAPALRDPFVQAEILKENPLKRVATAEEVAAAILFLASDLASFVNGEILNVNGGSVLVG